MGSLNGACAPRHYVQRHCEKQAMFSRIQRNKSDFCPEHVIVKLCTDKKVKIQLLDVSNLVYVGQFSEKALIPLRPQ